MKPRYWFRPSRPATDGDGGFPQTWQGWAIYAGFWGLLVVGILLILPQSVGIFVAYVFALVAILIFICVKKGEPPGSLPGRDRNEGAGR